MSVSRRLVGLRVGDAPAVWTAMGFTVDQGCIQVGGVRIELVGTEGGDAGLLGWSFDPHWRAPIDGLQIGAPPPTHDAAGLRHPNGVSAVDHLVVATPDVDRTTSALADAGIEPRRSVVGARGDADMLYRFFLLGTCVLEVIGPTEPTGDDPARFTGLAFTTHAIDELDELAGPPRPAVQHGRRIATLRPEVGASVPIAFLTPRAARSETG